MSLAQVSLAQARRKVAALQAMDALKAAGYDEKQLDEVERAFNALDIFYGLADMLVGSADVGKAKNYVKAEIAGLNAPWSRIYLELLRPDGRTSHEVTEELRMIVARLAELAREGFSQGWDGLDAKERLDKIEALVAKASNAPHPPTPEPERDPLMEAGHA